MGTTTLGAALVTVEYGKGVYFAAELGRPRGGEGVALYEAQQVEVTDVMAVDGPPGRHITISFFMPDSTALQGR
jgi:hypothetical protein